MTRDNQTSEARAEAVASDRPRKRTRYVLCDRHKPWFSGLGRYRIIECMNEGGPGGWTPGCEGGTCHLWPGTDIHEPSVCHGEMHLDWTEEEPWTEYHEFRKATDDPPYGQGRSPEEWVEDRWNELDRS